ncbi:hypothetical protein [Saccharopolyspora spinosa]|uniref:hypothetical protein n=1 Tax=Saccharopolyspora spinosa TaxID=60894 RepID=UPI001ED9100F|nr:hypothetical protein [Saccharopolyspora spinosa]
MPLSCAQCEDDTQELYRRGLCERCYLAVRLRALLDDGTGTVREDLRAFVDGLVAMPDPISGQKWSTRPHVQRMLRTLATYPGPISHEVITELERSATGDPWRSCVTC